MIIALSSDYIADTSKLTDMDIRYLIFFWWATTSADVQYDVQEILLDESKVGTWAEYSAACDHLHDSVLREVGSDD